MNSYIKIYFTLLVLVFSVFSAYATNYYTSTSGVFGTGSNWVSGTSPGANSISKYGGVNDTVFVRDAMTVATGFSVQGAQVVLVVESGGSVTVTGTGYVNAAHIIIDNGGLLDYSGTFSTANSAVDRVTINGTMNVGADINAAAGTWYIGPSGSLNVGGNILNNDPSMSFANDGDVYVENYVQFFTGTWTNGEDATFRTEGTDIFVGDATINNNGSMEFVNATNNTTWSGSFDCDGSTGTGSVDFGTNMSCAATCTGGGAASCASNVPLPVEWLSIEALVQNNKIAINWSTSSEKNNNFFVVEKSYDAQKWFSIGSIDGSGNSNQIKEYSFIDESLRKGLVYYRLVQVDYDGLSEHSDIVYVLVEEAEITSENNLYPNPNYGTFSINIPAEQIQYLEIYNLQQKKVANSLVESRLGVQVNILNPISGFYTAVITTNGTVLQKSFLVK